MLERAFAITELARPRPPEVAAAGNPGAYGAQRLRKKRDMLERELTSTRRSDVADHPRVAATLNPGCVRRLRRRHEKGHAGARARDPGAGVRPLTIELEVANTLGNQGGRRSVGQATPPRRPPFKARLSAKRNTARRSRKTASRWGRSADAGRASSG